MRTASEYEACRGLPVEVHVLSRIPLRCLTQHLCILLCPITKNCCLYIMLNIPDISQPCVLVFFYSVHVCVCVTFLKQVFVWEGITFVMKWVFCKWEGRVFIS